MGGNVFESNEMLHGRLQPWMFDQVFVLRNLHSLYSLLLKHGSPCLGKFCIKLFCDTGLVSLHYHEDTRLYFHFLLQGIHFPDYKLRMFHKKHDQIKLLQTSDIEFESFHYSRVPNKHSATLIIFWEIFQGLCPYLEGVYLLILTN